MASERTVPPMDGAVLGLQSFAKTAQAAACADDYVFAEFWKLPPFDGVTYAKAIAPFAVQGVNAAFIVPGNAAYPVVVMPFRAAIGSRVQASDVPVPPPPVGVGDSIMTTAPEQNARSIKSTVFATSQGIGVGAPAAGALGYPIPAASFASNAGNARFDLIYATVYLDQASSVAPTALVKPAAGGAPAPTALTPTFLTSVGSPPMAVAGLTKGIGVVTGASAGSAPSAPALPADNPAAGIFHIPLALIIIPNGFVSGDATNGLIATKLIAITAPVVTLAEASGGLQAGPCSEETGAAIATTADITGTNSAGYGTRSVCAVPVTMRGGVARLVVIDASSAAIVGIPFRNGDIIDKSIDWRNRVVRWLAYARGSATKFAWDPTASTGSYVPLAANSTPGTNTASGIGQTFRDDSVASIGGSSINAAFVCGVNNTSISQIASGPNAVGLYVSLADGFLRLYYLGTPAAHLIFDLFAYGAFDNP